MYGGRTVGVVVPAYNERSHVVEVLAAMPALVDRCYVVDDGSTDGTWETVRSFVAGREPRRDGPDFVPIRHRRNRGAGAAIKTGYARALADGLDVTVTIDADGQMDPGAMDRLLDPIVEGRADYAKGNRLERPADRGEMPSLRWVGNWLLTWLTKVASGYWHVRDPQNGYTAISHRALAAIDVDSLFDFYGYSNDVLVRLNAAEMRVADVPMPAAYGDERSSIRLVTYVPAVSSLLLRRFSWRLLVRVRTRAYQPVALCYLLGLLGAGFALFDLVGSAAIDPTGGPVAVGLPGALPSFILGGLFTAAGMAVDRRVNRRLEVPRE